MDERYKDVTIIRPLRDFLAKELTLFAHFMELESITPNDPLTSIILKNPSINTLERLTQDFLASLQAGGFPSTTGTILRTSSKVVLENDTQVNCSFCHYPICNTESSDDPDKLATESMKYSFLLSNPSSCSEVTIPEENDNNLCSSCSLMFKELSSCT
nr:SJCHGC09507 protein [Schistosoma japonicum]